MSKRFQQLAITKLDDFVFGHSPYPVYLKNGLTIGAGEVYPEINFTLPSMGINADTMPEVRNQYTQMIGEITKRAVELHATGFSVEFELLPDLTLNPEWGAEITKLLREKLDAIEQKEHIKTCLRVTPNDILRVARQYMIPENRTVGYFIPLPPQNIESNNSKNLIVEEEYTR